MRNPFQYGAELRPSQIVDRKTEIADVADAATNHGRVFLIGPRRCGKTAILRAADELATRRGAIVIRLDAEAYPSVELLVRAIITITASRLGTGVAKASKSIAQFFGRLRPTLSYSPLDQTWSGSINVQPPADKDATPLLIDAIDGLARLAKDAKRPTALMIDEFQRVIELGGATTEGQLHAAMRRHPDIGFVMAGSKTRLLNDMTLNPARPFYRMGRRHFLGPIPREDFARFLTRGFSRPGRGVKVDPDAITAILDRAEDVPYNVQALASVAWETLRDSGAHALTSRDVDRALTLLVGHDGPFYLTIRNNLTTVQQRVLTAAIEQRGTNLTAERVTSEYHVAASSIAKTLRVLEEKEILRREERVRTVTWRLEDPFFAAWLQEKERIG